MNRDTSFSGGAMKTVSEKTAPVGQHCAEAQEKCERRCLEFFEGESVGKSRITMRIDNDVLALFKAKADKTGGSYQTMMNSALKQFAQGLTLSEMIRQSIQETLESYLLQNRGKRNKDSV